MGLIPDEAMQTASATTMLPPITHLSAYIWKQHFPLEFPSSSFKAHFLLGEDTKFFYSFSADKHLKLFTSKIYKNTVKKTSITSTIYLFHSKANDHFLSGSQTVLIYPNMSNPIFLSHWKFISALHTGTSSLMLQSFTVSLVVYKHVYF